MPDPKPLCAVCKTAPVLNYDPHPTLCSNCGYWSEVRLKPGLLVQEDYRAYVLGHPKATTKGNGGMKLKVTLLGGATLETDDLWNLGKIPEVWRPQFVPNCGSIDPIREGD